MPVISVHRRQRQEDQEFKAISATVKTSIDYMRSYHPPQNIDSNYLYSHLEKQRIHRDLVTQNIGFRILVIIAK